jgi:hypothetical protein
MRFEAFRGCPRQVPVGKNPPPHLDPRVDEPDFALLFQLTRVNIINSVN